MTGKENSLSAKERKRRLFQDLGEQPPNAKKKKKKKSL